MNAMVPASGDICCSTLLGATIQAAFLLLNIIIAVLIFVGIRLSKC